MMERYVKESERGTGRKSAKTLSGRIGNCETTEFGSEDKLERQ